MKHFKNKEDAYLFLAMFDKDQSEMLNEAVTVILEEQTVIARDEARREVMEDYNLYKKLS